MVRRRALIGLLLLAVGLTLAWSGRLVGQPVLCPLRRFTGLPCASCGLTRAFSALARGHVRAALAHHLACLPLAAAVGLLAGLWLAEAVTGRPWLGPAWRRWGTVAVWTTLAAVLLGWGANLAAWAGHPLLGP